MFFVYVTMFDAHCLCYVFVERVLFRELFYYQFVVFKRRIYKNLYWKEIIYKRRFDIIDLLARILIQCPCGFKTKKEMKRHQ